MYYIFDLDGTVFDASHRMKYIEGEPKNWNKFFDESVNDPPIWEVMDVARALHSNGFGLLFITGRSERVLNITMERLSTFLGFDDYELYMRPEKDYRPDDVLKAEILQRRFPKTDPRRQVAGVFEDRSRVVKMYRNLGLRVFQVAEGDF